jgi:hypothetical protein
MEKIIVGSNVEDLEAAIGVTAYGDVKSAVGE